MFLRLLLRLALVPDEAWARIAAAERDRVALPTPIAASARLAGVAATAALIGAIWFPGATVGSVMLHALAATSGTLGACLVAVFVLAPRISIADPELVARWVSMSILPMLALQSLALLPMRPLIFAWTLFGAALSTATAIAGARVYLGLGATEARPLALRTIAWATLPIVAANAFRVFVIR